MTLIAAVSAVLGIVMAVGGAAGIVWGMTRAKGLDVTLDLISRGNAELREELEHERERRQAERERLTRELADERVACAANIARIEGQVQALTDGLAERIITATISAMQHPDRRQPLSP